MLKLLVLIPLLAVACNASAALRPKLALAQRDPFTPYVAPPPKLPKSSQAPKGPSQPPAPVVVPVPVAAPLPTAPELGLFYAGQMTTPSGERQVFALQRDQLLTLKTGMTLSNGFVVQAIEPRAVRFHYPATNSTARLNLPELPRFESR
jgi:hypothetical protein